MTTAKKPTKKLTVKNLENLKGGVVSVELTTSTEDTNGNKKTTMANQKGSQANAMDAVAGLSTRGGAISS